MAKVFYLGGGTHARGMLRAVVTLEQLNSCVSADAVSYMGTAFPENEFNLPVTVVEISPDEVAQPWATGFSRINETPADFDERVKFLPKSEEPPKENATAKAAQRLRPDSLAEEGHALMRIVLTASVKLVVGFVLACALATSLAAL